MIGIDLLLLGALAVLVSLLLFGFVALYNVDLSGGVPNDGGLTTVLGPHQAASGSF